MGQHEDDASEANKENPDVLVMRFPDAPEGSGWEPFGGSSVVEERAVHPSGHEPYIVKETVHYVFWRSR